MKISVLITCHNRKEKTLSCLEQLFSADKNDNLILSVFLVDDGSTDGTSIAIKEKYPAVYILYGDGNLYWSGGMRLAMKEALKHSFDYSLWLNDDTILYKNFLEVLLNDLDTARRFTGKECIITGCTIDPITEKTSYGGHNNKQRLELSGNIQEALYMNGNCVLIPYDIVFKLGTIDPVFTHSMGDFDYALRARKNGYKVFTSSKYIGTCSKNAKENTWEDIMLPLKKRMKLVTSVKGLPIKERFVLCIRQNGLLGVLFFIKTYTDIVISSCSYKIRKSLKRRG